MSAPHELAPVPQDAISHVQFSPSGEHLAVASWDGQVYIFNRSDEDPSQPYLGRVIVGCGAPVLNVAWNIDESIFYSVGLDKQVRQYTLSPGMPIQPRVLSEHALASNKVVFSAPQNLVLSTSWDSTLHVHDASTGAFVRVGLPAKPFALALTQEKVVVGMAERKVSVYDLGALRQLVNEKGRVMGDGSGTPQTLQVEPWQQRESSLKFMTRDIACMPDGTGFATSSIEGRVGVDWFDSGRQKDSYAFKCHRQSRKSTNENGEEQDIDVIFPVNALAFHPVHHTFATGGEDGAVAIWDAQTKRRVRQYKDQGSSVASIDFSPNGRYMVMGICPSYEQSKEEQKIDPSRIKILVRELAENEAKGKPKAEK